MKQIFHQSLSIFKLSCLPFSFVEQNVFIMYLMNLLMSMRPRVKEINVYSFFILCISIRESKKKSDKNCQFLLHFQSQKWINIFLSHLILRSLRPLKESKIENLDLKTKILNVNFCHDWSMLLWVHIFENCIKKFKFYITRYVELKTF